MRIAFDGLHLFGSAYAGIQGTPTRTLAAYLENFPDDEIELFVPKDFQKPRFNFFPDLPEQVKSSAPWIGPHPSAVPEDHPKLNIHRCWFRGKSRIIRTLWRSFRMQPLAYQKKCDVLHGPTYHLPPALSMPAVLTIHDLIAFTHPQFCTPASAKTQKGAVKRGVKSARVILTPTQAVKNQVVSLLKVPEETISVVPWAAGEEFKVVEDKDVLDAARKHWKLPERFLLYVGNIEPKKNLETAIQAFYAAKMHAKLPHSLVICGRAGWKTKKVTELIRTLNIQSDVFFTGYAPPRALPLIYNLADAFILPSHVEGFGVPLLEAMACGCPVIASDTPAIKEVTADAARLFSLEGKPLEALRITLEELLANSKDAKDKRNKLKNVGLKRAKEFSWKKTAELTREAYLKAMG